MIEGDIGAEADLSAISLSCTFKISSPTTVLILSGDTCTALYMSVKVHFCTCLPGNQAASTDVSAAIAGNGTNLNTDTMRLFKSFPVNWLVPDVSQVCQGSIELVLLRRWMPCQAARL